MHKPAAVLENDVRKLLLDFNIRTNHLILAWRPDFMMINKKKKRTCKIVDLALPTKHRVKLKEIEKKDKHVDLDWESKKKLWNTKVTFIPIRISGIGTVTEWLL